MGARMACLKSDRFLHMAAMFDHEEFFGHSAYSYGCHYVWYSHGALGFLTYSGPILYAHTDCGGVKVWKMVCNWFDQLFQKKNTHAPDALTTHIWIELCTLPMSSLAATVIRVVFAFFVSVCLTDWVSLFRQCIRCVAGWACVIRFSFTYLSFIQFLDTFGAQNGAFIIFCCCQSGSFRNLDAFFSLVQDSFASNAREKKTLPNQLHQKSSSPFHTRCKRSQPAKEIDFCPSWTVHSRTHKL